MIDVREANPPKPRRKVVDHVMLDQLEARVADQVRDVAAPAGEEAVQADDASARNDKPVAKMRTNEARTAGNKRNPLALIPHAILPWVVPHPHWQAQVLCSIRAPAPKRRDARYVPPTVDEAGSLCAAEALSVPERRRLMPAKSKAQQKAAGAALSAKRGDTPKSKLQGASKSMMSMSEKELEKMASTKRKGKPEHAS